MLIVLLQLFKYYSTRMCSLDKLRKLHLCEYNSYHWINYWSWHNLLGFV